MITSIPFPVMKELSQALAKAIKEEHLWNAEAGRFLNLKSNYVGCIISIKCWQHAPVYAWDRVKMWYETKEPISSFRIPEGEAIVENYETKSKHNSMPATEMAESFKIAQAKKEELSKLEPLKKQEKKCKKPGKSDVPTLKLNADLTKFIEGLVIQEVNKHSAGIGSQSLKLDIEVNLVLNGHRIPIA